MISKLTTKMCKLHPLKWSQREKGDKGGIAKINV